MDTRKHMIIIKGEVKTPEIRTCRYNPDTKKVDVEFNNGRKYAYAYSNVERLKEPKVLNPNMYHIARAGQEFFGMEEIYVFQGKDDSYWHIVFQDGSERDYCQRDLKIEESCLLENNTGNVFEYLKQIAALSEIRNEETKEKILAKKFDRLSFIGKDVVLAKYLSPGSVKENTTDSGFVPVFPFGCNNSQYKAVKRAMENQISVIQGPPGTGKTQTILNIIANILIQGKTVQIVSNNNSATENVYEKLSSPKYNLGFIAAMLGSSKNKNIFIEQQQEDYPDFSLWKTTVNQMELQQSIREKSLMLKSVFDNQEQLAALKQEYARLITELKYFNEYVGESDVSTNGVKGRKKLTSQTWMLLWQECQMISEEKQKIGVLLRIKYFFKYGITDRNFYKQDISKIITTFQAMYYEMKREELLQKIEETEKKLNSVEANLMDDLCKESMMMLKGKLAKEYEKKEKRKIFDISDLWKNPYEVLREYPVILSTTFSSNSSLNPDVVYDYIIMDEASQVDIATGALALSCARNVVIVGDMKQLPNVVTEDTRKRAAAIFDSFHISEGYRYTNSFLQSVLDVMPDVAQTLLREHYRCHPKIINFCNQKFYRGELIIMTKDQGEEDVLKVVKTVPGNHQRDHYSQRQIDIIKEEVLPNCVENAEEIGIITPYKNQVQALKSEIQGIDTATVHKFQGKEKDTIVISTVDDEISDFTDDPYMINVAVSRAKKQLILVVTGNQQVKERNITDLVDYIQYNNFEVTDSKIYSIFDYLYQQYTKERKAYLKKHKKVSAYDSENLMYSLIEEVLTKNKYASLDVVCHFPLNMLIRNPELLDEKECKYAMNPATHVDFLIYNRISKKPVLAVEVDGYEYHREDSQQALRDLQKNHIMELYEIPLIRFKTNGSREREKLTEILDRLVE